jgi:glycosyltransferase involved in cell wall biosynthesis
VSNEKPVRRLSSISIVFPAYNEQENVETSVVAARKALAEIADKIQIVVVNDGSADGTRQILDRLAREHADVVVVHHESNQGYGAALRSGFARATGEYVFFTDADLQFDLAEIGLLVRWIGEFDIVAGYRAKRADPWNRRLNAWAWNLLVRLVLGLKVRDIDCAFKLFRRRVFDTVRLSTVGAMVNTEILAKAMQGGFTLREIPVSHYPRRHGVQTGANLAVILKALRELFAMYGKLRQLRADSAPPVADADMASRDT